MNNNPDKKLFAFPWKYKESFVIALILFVLGIAVELITGDAKIIIPKFPTNLLIILLYSALIIFLQIVERENKIVQWLSSSPAAIVSIIYILFLSTLLGLTPQFPTKEALMQHLQTTELSGKWILLYKLGITNMTQSWLFFTGMVYVLTTLGFVTARRAYPFTKKNVGFFINHFGLYLVIIAGVAGVSDKQDFFMVVQEGDSNTTQISYGKDGKRYQMPFAVTLHDFQIEEYPPKLVYYNSHEQEIKHQNDETPFEFSPNAKGSFADWEVEVQQYLPNAYLDSTKFVETNEPGNVQAAYMTVKNSETGKEYSGWISCGNIVFPRVDIKVGEKEHFVMLPAEISKYQSDITISRQDGSAENFIIEVNKPIKYHGWKIYQAGYDDKMGKWSNKSTFQLVKDPWLPVVYFGIFMLLAGAVYIFWIGRAKKN